MVRGSYPDGQEHPEQMAEGRLHRQAGLLPNRRRNPAGRANHSSYNVAKKVLEFEFTAEIPRIHLRASYGDGFKGAPLTCEGSLTRNPGELDDQAAKKEVHALGGPRHV